MSKNISLRVLATASVLLVAASECAAQYNLRSASTLRGNVVLIGNTLGYDAATGTPAPVVGTVGAVGTNTADSSADVFWRSNSPSTGQAVANTSITVAQARSQAVLTLPPGSTVRLARLYWASSMPSANPDLSVDLERVGVFATTVTADAWYSTVSNTYQSTADITALVQAHGPGAYQVGGVDCVNVVNANNNILFAGWSMVVVYTNPADPVREVRLIEGLSAVLNGSPIGLVVPTVQSYVGSGIIELGVVVYEGDNTISGDQLVVNGTPVSNAQNPVTNVFNSTRTRLGSAVSVAGDLPQLTGGPQSFACVDIDVFDVTPLVPAQGSISLQFSSSGDVYYPGVVTVSMPVASPCAGDVTGDGEVNIVDLTALLLYFGQSVSSSTQGDLNGDGVVNTIDLAILLLNFGRTCQ